MDKLDAKKVFLGHLDGRSRRQARGACLPLAIRARKSCARMRVADDLAGFRACIARRSSADYFFRKRPAASR